MVRVYLSSTFEDLKDQREAVYRVLRGQEYDVVAMEDYVARDDRPLERCLRDVRACDVYIGVFAFRYGSIPPGQPEGVERSITELEYREASAEGKERLCFLLAGDAFWPVNLVDEDRSRIEALRMELQRTHSVAVFRSTEQLCVAVLASIVRWERESGRRPALGRDSAVRDVAVNRRKTAERDGRVDLYVPEALARRYEAARERLRGIGPYDFDLGRIHRLRQEIDAFRRDLKFLDEGGSIVLVPDPAEIGSYLDPYSQIGTYCFPIEDRATFDRQYAKQQGREASFDRRKETRQIARRVLRARAHLFNAPKHNLLLPPYLHELELLLSFISAAREADDLEAVFAMIQNDLARLELDDAGLLRELAEFDTLTEDRRTGVLDAVFTRILANPIDFSDDMGANERGRRISRIARADDFVQRTKSYSIDEYDWLAILVGPNPDLIDRLRNVTPDTALLRYLVNLFGLLPRSTRMTLAAYNDALALAYLAALNELLSEVPGPPVRLQLVTWALSPMTVARAFWPEAAEANGAPPLVQVRHPKLLAAVIGGNGRVDRSQVEGDLNRFSEALNLFDREAVEDGPDMREGKLAQVRKSWEQLDNTLLAWAAPIGSKLIDGLSSGGERSLESIQRVVVNYRPQFEDYLARKIDSVSKDLSDSHWRVVQPSRVENVDADVLQFLPGRRIVLRSREDHARFAIALYDAWIIQHIHESLDREEPFGRTLLRITREPAGETELGDPTRGRRAETQLLKAFLFAVLGDNILAARYCGLARAELGQARDAYHCRIRAEIHYLEHHAHRSLGIEKSLTSLDAAAVEAVREFFIAVKWLESSWAESRADTQQSVDELRPRYLASWLTLCREIAAVNVPEFRLNPHSQRLVRVAYEGCVEFLSGDHAGHAGVLEHYHVGRAAESVMLVFMFNRLDIGCWRRSFGEVIRPTEAHARLAWEQMRRLRSEGGQRWSGRIDRGELAYWVGTFWFGDSAEERVEAGRLVTAMRAAFETDPTLQRAVADFVRESGL